MDKFWERYIKSRPAPGESKGAFDAFAAASRDPGPRTMAQGGRIGYWQAGAVKAAPYLTYPVTLGLANILGIATAGVGATALSGAVANKIKENPEILDTPQAKAIMLAFGLTPSGLVFGPDADAIEKEKERFRELSKPGKTYVPDNKGWIESFPDLFDNKANKL